jgi:hypothetical protein
MTLLEAFDAIVLRGAAPELAARVVELRSEFEGRTGKFTPEDAWFEARSRAFWDDAITSGKFAHIAKGHASDGAGEGAPAVAGSARLSEDVRALVPAFERAHRGLFVIASSSSASSSSSSSSASSASSSPSSPSSFSLASSHTSRHVLRDVWSGVELVVDEIDEGMRDALAAASAPFDARVVGAMIGGVPRVTLLPGAIFHPEDAVEPITAVLKAARAQGLSTHDTLDALLRMERALRTLSRMKASYAYRASALARSA